MSPPRCPPSLLPALLVVLLSACASAPEPTPPPATLPGRWSTPLPHAGDPVAMQDWWRRTGDPALADLVAEADRRSPTVDIAAARVAQARAAAGSARASLWPSFGLGLSATRVRQPVTTQPAAPVTPGAPAAPSGSTSQAIELTTAQAGLDAAWEIDLFGARRQALSAAQARVRAGELQWHDARISLAAEVAQAYVGLRACEAVAQLLEQQARSQSRSAELTSQKVRVGFDAPATGALADAAAAESASRLGAQQAECDVLRQALVLLTGLPLETLQPRLAGGTARLPQPQAFTVREVPAQALSQRPDVRAAQEAVAAAAADLGSARAQRWPVLRLVGTLAAVATEVAGVRVNSSSWSIGPALQVPLFDGGLRASNVDAASARYDEARAQFELQARRAVREVEESLIRLDAAHRRTADAQRAAQGFAEHFRAAEQRWEVGAGSLIDMEDARRLALNAQAALVDVQRERVAAWIALYKAMGGGWDGTQGAE